MGKITLGISPGTRILGYAVFINGDLIDYGVKTIKGKWSEGKLFLIRNTVKKLCLKYDVNTIALKIPLSHGNSKRPDMVISEITTFAHALQIAIPQYTRKDICELIGIKGGYRKPLMEWVLHNYPELKREYEIEIKGFSPPYYRKMFEAIVMAKETV